MTKDLTKYVAGTKFEDLPQNVVRLAKQLILDQVGCAFDGSLTYEAKMFSIKVIRLHDARHTHASLMLKQGAQQHSVSCDTRHADSARASNTGRTADKN